jgi:hypothetical protein
MTTADAPTFVSALAALAEVFDKDLSDAAQTLYFDALKEFPLPAVLAAMQAASQTRTFMPRIAEIRNLIVGGDRPIEALAELAWQTFQTTAHDLGAYRSPHFEDGALAATVLSMYGSWERACTINLSDEMLVAKRREWGRVYALHVQEGHTAPRTLVGYCERVNRENGYDEAPAGPRLLPPATRHDLVEQHEQQRLEAASRYSTLVEEVQRGFEAAWDRYHNLEGKEPS